MLFETEMQDIIKGFHHKISQKWSFFHLSTLNMLYSICLMHFLLVWMLFLLGIEEKCEQGREISGCDAISLTGFGLILTLRTD
jgi:glycopeptide antibiotics resistance protein